MRKTCRPVDKNYSCMQQCNTEQSNMWKCVVHSKDKKTNCNRNFRKGTEKNELCLYHWKNAHFFDPHEIVYSERSQNLKS